MSENPGCFQGSVGLVVGLAVNKKSRMLSDRWVEIVDRKDTTSNYVDLLFSPGHFSSFRVSLLLQPQMAQPNFVLEGFDHIGRIDD